MFYLVFFSQFDTVLEKIVTPVVILQNAKKTPFLHVFLSDENGFGCYSLHSDEVRESYGVVIDFIVEKDFPKLVEELQAWENLSTHHYVKYVGCRP